MTLFGKSVLAVVPARGGSKSIKRKNLRQICGKSLIKYAADICNQLPWIDYSIISTDDEEMAEEGRSNGLEVPFIRPKDLANDTSSSLDMWRHAWLNSENIKESKFDISILLEPTSPLRTSDDIKNCVSKLIKYNYEGVITVSLMPAHYRPQKTLKINNNGSIGFYLPRDDSYTPRQKIPPYYYRNGICYAVTREKLIQDKVLLDETFYAMVINREVVNIDEPFDLDLAEFLIKRL